MIQPQHRPVVKFNFASFPIQLPCTWGSYQPRQISLLKPTIWKCRLWAWHPGVRKSFKNEREVADHLPDKKTGQRSPRLPRLSVTNEEWGSRHLPIIAAEWWLLGMKLFHNLMSVECERDRRKPWFSYVKWGGEKEHRGKENRTGSPSLVWNDACKSLLGGRAQKAWWGRQVTQGSSL